MIPYSASFHISDTTPEKRDQLLQIARTAESTSLRVRNKELGDEQGYLGGHFIEFVARSGSLDDDEAVNAMVGIYDDVDLLESLNAVEGVIVTPQRGY